MKTSKNAKIENMDTNKVANETLAETQENANVEIETPTIESLTEKIKVAKKELYTVNDTYDFDETNAEIIAKEKQIADLVNERKLLAKQLEKTAMERKHAETLATSKEMLNEFVSTFVTNETIDYLLSDNADAKKKLEEIKFAFNFVFGKQPLVVKENVTGSQLAKSSVKTNGGTNITQSVRDMLTAGNDNETIVNFLLNNGFDDEKVAKKRLTDIRWKWEIDNGIRVKK